MATPWPVARGNPANTGFADVTTKPALRNPITVPGLGTFAPGVSPVIAPDGTVYIGNEQGTVFAFHPDGTPFWNREIVRGQGGIAFSPAIGSDGTVYVISQYQARDNRAGAPHPKIYRASLHRFTSGGGYLGHTALPIDGAGPEVEAPPNIWRYKDQEAVIVLARYHAGHDFKKARRLLAFTTTGALIGEGYFILGLTSLVGGSPLPSFRPRQLVPPPPGVAIYTPPGIGSGTKPYILVAEPKPSKYWQQFVAGFTFSPDTGFALDFRVPDDEAFYMLSTPMVMPDGVIAVGQQQISEYNRNVSTLGSNGAVLLIRHGHNTGRSSLERIRDGLGRIYATPTLTVNGMLVVVEYGKGLALIREGKVVSRVPEPGATVHPPSASRTHVYLAVEDALVTYDDDAQAVVARFPWANGGKWPPAIGPQGHVYAMASNILFVFRPEGGRPSVEKLKSQLHGIAPMKI